MGSDEKADIDLKDIENGPLTEANRECRDTLCCLLFFAGLCGMVYLGVYGYTMGTPSKIFRGVDQAGNICGDTTNSVSVSYPYLYFTNPYSNIQLRACVASCPYWTGSAVTTISCAVPSQCNTNTYQVTYDSSGNTASGTSPPSSTDTLGYDSYVVLDRVCVPNSNMFTTIFSTVSSTVSSALNQGALADFIQDTKNVSLALLRTGNGC
jgi:hypothetical protein